MKMEMGRKKTKMVQMLVKKKRTMRWKRRRCRVCLHRNR